MNEDIRFYNLYVKNVHKKKMWLKYKNEIKKKNY